MAWRGRGRGRPGGFARHDIKLEDEEVSDIPFTFPPAPSMPQKASAQTQDPQTLRMLNRFNIMRSSFTRSAFHLPLTVEEQVEGSAPDVLRYLDAGAASAKSPAKEETPLHQVIVMHEKYLPAELYSAKDQKASLKKKNADFFQSQGGKPKVRDLDQELDQLARQHGGKDDDDKEGDEEDKKEGEEAAAEVDDDDELDHEDDDYYQGEHYDDDEEYGADDDDGDGEAYF